jgi:hypothetical protein
VNCAPRSRIQFFVHRAFYPPKGRQVILQLLDRPFGDNDGIGPAGADSILGNLALIMLTPRATLATG